MESEESKKPTAKPTSGLGSISCAYRKGIQLENLRPSLSSETEDDSNDGVPKPPEYRHGGAEIEERDRPDWAVLEIWGIERMNRRRQLKRKGLELTVVV
jgi:hypothetical protein